MTNILRAVQNLIVGHDVHVGEVRESNNRANSLGEAFEIYIKNVFAGAFGLTGTAYQKKIEEVFSYQGSAGKPPDLMIRGGDAIEIKKLQSRDSQIQLNSSFPKNKLHADDSRISSEAKNAERWTEKDILYIVGNVDAKSKTVRSMWWIYGDCLIDECAGSIANRIFSSDAIRTNFEKEGEILIANLGIGGSLSLSLKAQWCFKGFADSPHSNQAPFLNVVMREEKYRSFPESDRMATEGLAKEGKVEVRSVVFPRERGKSLVCKQIYAMKGGSHE